MLLFFIEIFFRYISYVLPQTFACEAMRGILLRGWGITYMPGKNISLLDNAGTLFKRDMLRGDKDIITKIFFLVWRGFVVTIAWIVATYAIFKKLVMKES